MYIFKQIIFLEFFALLVCGICHLGAFITGNPFPLLVYPMVMGTVLLVSLLVVFVIGPLGEWFLD